MRSFLKWLSVAVFVLVSTEAKAETFGFLEVQTKVASPRNGLTLDGGIGYKISDSFGATSFFLVTNGWAQLYAGPTWKPNEMFELGVSFGGEQGAEGIIPRYALSTTFKKDKLSLVAVLEFNNETFSRDFGGVWYDLNFTYSFREWLAFGLKDRRPDGIGPIVQFTYSKFGWWVSWMPVSSETGAWQPKELLFGLTVSI